MKIVGLMLVRNEEWILGLTLPAALSWCDEVIVLDHDSEDATPDIVRDISIKHPGRVYLMFRSGDWMEMDFRQAMLEVSRERGATHHAVIDADELLTGGPVRDLIRPTAKKMHEGQALALPMIACWRSVAQHRVDAGSPWGSAQTPIVIADSKELTWRPRPDGYQLHGRIPHGAYPKVLRPLPNKGAGGMFHLQWLFWERLLWKQRHYLIRERVTYGERDTAKVLNQRYAASVDETGLELDDVPYAWWEPYVALLGEIKHIPGWHQRYCEANVGKIPKKLLEGLDFWGWEPRR